MTGQRCPTKQMALSVQVLGPESAGLECESLLAAQGMGILELSRKRISRAVVTITITERRSPPSTYVLIKLSQQSYKTAFIIVPISQMWTLRHTEVMKLGVSGRSWI